MERKQQINQIQKCLGKRGLLWLGLRGVDAEVLLQIPQLSEIFSIIAPFRSTSAVSETCLETLQKRRNDLHTYDPAIDASPEAREFGRLFFTALGKPTAILTYRPDNFLSSNYFPRCETVLYLGLLHELQASFENKSWVEMELAKQGIRTIPWHYYGAYNHPNLEELLKQGPVVVRAGRYEGGAGLTMVRNPEDVDIQMLLRHNAFLAIAPYLEQNVPININACVFPDGEVSLHGPCLQLIGIPSCTTLPLGYCGNDFTQIREMDPVLLDELEILTVQVGKWLVRMGYLGAFGIDAVAYKGHIYLTELNARFQNSSVISAEIDRELERPDLYLNHMAAFLGICAPAPVRLRELTKAQRRISQIICYNCQPQTVIRTGTTMPKTDGADFTLLPEADVEVVPEGMLFKLLVNGKATQDGHTILKEYEEQIYSMIASFTPGTRVRK